MYSRGQGSLQDSNKVHRSVRLIRNNSDRFLNEAAQWVPSYNLTSPDRMVRFPEITCLIICEIYLMSVSALQCSF